MEDRGWRRPAVRVFVHLPSSIFHLGILTSILHLPSSYSELSMPLPTPPIFRRSRRGRRKPAAAPPPPPPPPSGPLVLHVVRATPSTYVFEFDRPVVASSPSGSNLTVNGMSAISAGNLDDTHIVIEF